MKAAVVLGSRETEHVRITVGGRVYPDATDYWDGNWVHTRIQVHAGGFSADIDASLRTDDLHRFAEGMRSVDETLTGAAVLRTLEEWIDLTVACEPNGQLRIVGEVGDRPDGGNRLTFELHHLDQTYLSPWVDQLAEIERAFPVIGRT